VGHLIIAVDGPLAAGKGTIAKALAVHYGLPFMDTGKLYRGVALAVITAGGDPNDSEAAQAAAHSLDMSGVEDSDLRTAAVGSGASIVAANQPVRRALFDLQRNFATQEGGAVLDGRDIGTVVCPEADVKIYVYASPEERAERRRKELAASGEIVSFEAMLAQTLERDARDSGRADAPLKAADDAHLLDTTGLSIEAAVEKARLIVDQALLAKG
jgi:CMP/dCMP kinase